jgi:alpha-mannosidase
MLLSSPVDKFFVHGKKLAAECIAKKLIVQTDEERERIKTEIVWQTVQ